MQVTQPYFFKTKQTYLRHRKIMMRTNTRVTARLAATMPPAIAPSLPGSVIGRWVAAATPVSEMQDTSYER